MKWKYSMENIDILIFAGQSNMQGETEGLPDLNPTINNAFEYRFTSDSLKPLNHPVGEDINGDILCGAKNGCGTLVPHFCNEYIKNIGRKVVAVHIARGSTTLSQWLKGTDRYFCMTEKINSAIKKVKENYRINKMFFIWLQGESDAIIGTTQKEYEKMIIDFKNAVNCDFNIDKFCIIEIGYFCHIAPWLELSKNGQGIFRDEEIMRAQESVVEKDKSFIMLTDICKVISLDSQYMNPNVGGHFNNKGMALLGKTAGKQLAIYEKGEV